VFRDERALAAVLGAATAEPLSTVRAVSVRAASVPAGPAGTMASGPTGAPAEDGRRRGRQPRPASPVTQAVLLVSIFVGGLIAAVTSGRFHLRFDMGAGYRDVVTGNPVGREGRTTAGPRPGAATAPYFGGCPPRRLV
jgi:hypothetical protein